MPPPNRLSGHHCPGAENATHNYLGMVRQEPRALRRGDRLLRGSAAPEAGGRRGGQQPRLPPARARRRRRRHAVAAKVDRRRHRQRDGPQQPRQRATPGRRPPGRGRVLSPRACLRARVRQRAPQPRADAARPRRPYGALESARQAACARPRHRAAWQFFAEVLAPSRFMAWNADFAADCERLFSQAEVDIQPCAEAILSLVRKGPRGRLFLLLLEHALVADEAFEREMTRCGASLGSAVPGARAARWRSNASSTNTSGPRPKRKRRWFPGLSPPRERLWSSPRSACTVR